MCAGGARGKAAGNNCQGSFLYSICILTPFYTHHVYGKETTLELLRRICLVAYQANEIKRPRRQRSRNYQRGESERHAGDAKGGGGCAASPNRSLQHLATFCFNFALLKSGSRHLDALLMLHSSRCKRRHSPRRSRSRSRNWQLLLGFRSSYDHPFRIPYEQSGYALHFWQNVLVLHNNQVIILFSIKT